MTRSFAFKSTALVVAGAAAGVSSLFLAASPAAAVPTVCGAGTLVSGNICEQTFTSGTTTFTPNASMTQLEVLLVGGGGDGTNHTAAGGPPINFPPEYGPGGGGGGAVKIVDLSADTSTPFDLTVGPSDTASSVTQGATVTSAAGGGRDLAEGGESGNGNLGWSTTPPAGAGAGAGGVPSNEYDGGAGITPAALAPSGSLFSADATCYAGGGAIAFHGGTVGTATCGGGYATDGATSTTDFAPTANSGGGGGGGDIGTQNPTNSVGASGVIVVRWNAPTVTLTFASSHGSSVPPETVVFGEAPTKPANPTADGYVFKGWFTDPGLTTPADFSAPLTADTTFYPSFGPALATTGGTISPFETPIGLGAVGTGLALAFVAMRRRRARHAA